MFCLINGIPHFYIGIINGEYGYCNEKEKQEIIKMLNLVDYTDEKITVDEDYKKKCIELGKKQLTYSKAEFLKLLEQGSKKTIEELEKELEAEKKKNKISMLGLMEVNNRLRILENDKGVK